MTQLSGKYFILVGGFIGFSAGFVISLSAGSDATYALRDAAICCCAGAFLFRIGSQFINASIAELAQQKAGDAVAKESANEEATSHSP